MKKPFLLAILLAGLVSLTSFGQDSRPQVSPEDRAKRTIERLKPEISLTEQQELQLMPVYIAFFADQDKIRSSGERPTPEARQKMTDSRDEKLKKVLSEDQMKKLKEVEEKMRQRRPGGPGGPGGTGQ